MCTLLLAEDEFYTRKGLLKHINFASMGITLVLEAADGRAGLAIARENTIDILLTDVRMPHMDGIELARSIRVLYPDCIILFLSGYSDKEYLRSAISLQTFRYLDKPLDTNLVAEALSEAVQFYNKKSHSYSFTAKAQKSSLAKELISTVPQKQELYRHIKECGLSESQFCDSRTMLIHFLNPQLLSSSAPTSYDPPLKSCIKAVRSIFNRYHMPVLICEYKELYILIHLLSSRERMVSALSKDFLDRLTAEIHLALPDYPHIISVGELVTSAEHVIDSYNSAVISLESNYFLGIGSVSYADEPASGVYEMSMDTLHSLQQSIISENRTECYALLNVLKSEFKHHPATLRSSVKSSYHGFLSWLYHYWSNRQPEPLGHSEHYLWEAVSTAATFDELHEFVSNYCNTFFSHAATNVPHCMSDSIKAVISGNYVNPDLGIQFISERLKLSCSHLSGMFKQETGETINQYIQNFRIQKAKFLLLDGNMKVCDVAERCGYPDSNYFAKLFKKLEGLSPSEYREVGFR